MLSRLILAISASVRPSWAVQQEADTGLFGKRNIAVEIVAQALKIPIAVHLAKRCKERQIDPFLEHHHGFQSASGQHGFAVQLW